MKCQLKPKDDCQDCPYEGCLNYGAELEEGALEEEG